MNFLAYLHSCWVTHKKLFDLFSKEQNFQNVWENLEVYLTKMTHWNVKEREEILQKYSKFSPKKIDDILKKLDVSLIDFYSWEYPARLKMISNPPFILYVRGKIDTQESCFSVIGSRKMSNYWKKAGEIFVKDLSEYFTIVSGGAGWCDTLAHRVCVENHKKTIVVFGTGIDQTYPAGNASLFEAVIQNGGALVSSFPLWTTGNVYTFPVRNEIVAGMSVGVLLLEAWQSSGTLITAQLALDQGKDVFAVPGDIFHPNFEGTHALIQSGSAQLVTKSEDILREYHYKSVNKNVHFSFQNDIQTALYDLLKYHLSLSVDEILEKTDFSYAEISLNLSLMEILWALKKDIFWKYERTN